jgi:hypothetical protein
MNRLVVALLLIALAGCASVEKIDSGDRTIGDRLLVSLDGAWNRINAPGLGPAQTWTMEGLPIDQLLLYSGIKDGQVVHPELYAAGETAKKSFSFRSTMQPHEIASMFEGMLTRDGSAFKLLKLEPANFGGMKGFRFDYALTRKLDNVQLSGVGYGAVNRGELFAILYMAPRLAFFSRHAERVERISQSARLKE